MKNKFRILIIVLSFISVYACGSGGSGGDDDIDTNPNNPVVITPSNLEVEVTIVGLDNNNPNGDGSGIVQFSATAMNAVKFGFKYGTQQEQQNTTGDFEYEFSQLGTETYTVTLYAYSSTGHGVSTNKFVTVFVEPELVWSDEFDVDGAVSTSNWLAETVPPFNGSWANGEKQHYTDRLDNAYVSNGTLKIVAKRETYTFENSTKEYTSARLITKDKYEFTYGRIDVRAKLPDGLGTWPAIWTLGANIDAVSWPACGEIDIMEHWRHDNYPEGQVSSATHTTACSGGCPNVSVGHTNLPDYNTEFHVYSVEWKEDELNFLIDGNFRYRYRPSPQTTDNWPYSADQFIILNVAMGGSWFEIDPNFTESTMEVDYVRVYQ